MSETREFLKPKDGQRESTAASITEGEAQWWETAEDHRFALEVLQLRLRRLILKYIVADIVAGTRRKEEIAAEFGLSIFLAEYHLSMMEKALVIQQSTEGYSATKTGILFLEKVEARD